MAQKVTGFIKLQIPAGKATPAPPVGPALGQHGVNIMAFTKEFNERTKNDVGLVIPVVITVYADRSFTFVTKTPPAAVLIKKACGIEHASGAPNKQKVAKITREQVKKIADRAKLYDAEEALDVCIKTAKAKFDETVEAHIKLGVDSRHADQQVRGAIVLPNGTGKNVRVLAICKGDNVEKAQAAGAEFVGGEEMAAKIQQEGWMDFDVVITTPDMMGVVGRLGKVLGPRGLMPNPKAGTVTPDIAKAVTEAKAGKIEYRLDKTNIIHCPIGKASFGVQKLQENFDTLMGAIVKAKPAAAKGQYIKSCVVATTMGPGIRLNPNKFGA